MNERVKALTILGVCGLAACMYKPQGSPTPQPVTLSWSAVTTDDGGKRVPERITYNVYAVSGAGPIPTTPSQPCNATTVAKGAPINSEPIVVTTYSTSLAPGLWTFAVEAVSSGGCRSALSSSATVTVPTQGNSSTAVTVTP